MYHYLGEPPQLINNLHDFGHLIDQQVDGWTSCVRRIRLQQLARRVGFSGIHNRRGVDWITSPAYPSHYTYPLVKVYIANWVQSLCFYGNVQSQIVNVYRRVLFLWCWSVSHFSWYPRVILTRASWQLILSNMWRIIPDSDSVHGSRVTFLWVNELWLPSSKPLHHHGKSPSWIGSINYFYGPFSIVFNSSAMILKMWILPSCPMPSQHSDSHYLHLHDCWFTHQFFLA